MTLLAVFTFSPIFSLLLNLRFVDSSQKDPHNCIADMTTIPTYETFLVQADANEGVFHVKLNRPKKSNAMNPAFWRESKQVFEWAAQETAVKVIILSGEGKNFSAGLDLADSPLNFGEESCEGKKRLALYRMILEMQEAFTSIERCKKPVIAAVHGACYGGGIDMITACCFRYCTKDAFFSVKEIDLAMTADVGTLQRLPKVIPSGKAYELAYTGRKFSAEEAEKIGLVNQMFVDKDAMMAHALDTAKIIASKSALAMTGIKTALLYVRDHPVPDSLNQVALWNSSMLLSDDLFAALSGGRHARL